MKTKRELTSSFTQSLFLVLLLITPSIAEETLCGWLELIDANKIVVGGYDKKAPADKVQFFISIDGKEIALKAQQGAKTTEQSGTQPYSRMAVDYQQALKSIAGSGYQKKTYALKLGAASQSGGKKHWFYEAKITPSPTSDFSAEELGLKIDSSVRRMSPEDGLEVWLSAKESKRTHFALTYKDKDGIARVATAAKICSGMYSAFLPGYPTEEKTRGLQVLTDRNGVESEKVSASKGSVKAKSILGSWFLGATNAATGAATGGASLIPQAAHTTVDKTKEFAGYLHRDNNEHANKVPNEKLEKFHHEERKRYQQAEERQERLHHQERMRYQQAEERQERLHHQERMRYEQNEERVQRLHQQERMHLQEMGQRHDREEHRRNEELERRMPNPGGHHPGPPHPGMF